MLKAKIKKLTNECAIFGKLIWYFFFNETFAYIFPPPNNKKNKKQKTKNIKIYTLVDSIMDLGVYINVASLQLSAHISVLCDRF